MADENTIDLENPAVKDAIAAAVAEATSGLKNKNAELLGKLKTASDELKTFQTQFDGLDIEAVKGLLTKVGQDEETKLIAEGKLDEVFNRRTERLRQEYDKKVKAAEDRAAAAEQSSAALRERALADAVRNAAIKAGALPEAADDFVFRSRGQFSFTEDGEVIAVDREGQAIFGKDGKSPLSPLEWAESLRETAPHLWPRAVGANAPGGGGKATKQFNDLTEAERKELYRTNPDQYRQLRDAATTKE